MDDDSTFSQAQCSLFRPDEITEFCKCLYLDETHVETAMLDLVGWDLKTINLKRITSQDPVLEMFKELRQRDFCNGFCRFPDVHFDEKKCAAIGILYSRVQYNTGVCRLISDPKVRSRIIHDVRAIAKQDGVDMEPSFPLYTVARGNRFNFLGKLSSFFRMKKIVDEKVDVLLVDSFADEADLQSSPALYNLLLNIEKNFTLFIVSDIRDRDINLWKDYTKYQINENADCVVVVATQLMIDNYATTNPELTDDQLRVSILGDVIRTSRKPVFAVTFNTDLTEKARHITPFVFRIPEQISFLLDMIKRVKKPTAPTTG